MKNKGDPYAKMLVITVTAAPWVLTLLCSLFFAIAGTYMLGRTERGLDAFLLIWETAFDVRWWAYLPGIAVLIYFAIALFTKRNDRYAGENK